MNDFIEKTGIDKSESEQPPLFEISIADFKKLSSEDKIERRGVMDRLQIREGMGPVVLGVLTDGENAHGRTADKRHRFTVSTDPESFGRIELN